MDRNFPFSTLNSVSLARHKYTIKNTIHVFDTE